VAAEYLKETEGKVLCPGFNGPSFFGLVRLQVTCLMTIDYVPVASELLISYLSRWFH